MINPPIDELLKVVDCRYALVIATSRRAREIVEHSERLDENPITTATHEIFDGKVTYEKYYD